MILMIDNYDSFTYNLVQYIRALGFTITVFHNDKISLSDIEKLNPSHIILSPGPGNPDEAGITLSVVTHFYHQFPILGVCLGHQAIAQALGGKVCAAQRVMHGKTSFIYHDNTSVFKNLPNPLIATRYHSLIVDRDSLPEEFSIIAWTQRHDGEADEIMAISSKQTKLIGVQFHPESILTEYGEQLLFNFLK